MIRVLFSLVFYLALSSVTSLSGNECDKNGILIYEDLGCIAEYGEDRQCPKKYSCKGLEPSTEHCYFRGKAYKDGEYVDNSLTIPSCDDSCSCSVQDGRAKFTCAAFDCPEWLGISIPPSCYRTYSLENCCAVGNICPKNMKDVILYTLLIHNLQLVSFDNIEKCVVGGQEYREGEKFYPPNTCLKCICQKGFKGKLEEPFCKRRVCGQQVRNFGAKIQASCAPFYTKYEQALCCPVDWICSDGSETFQGEAKSEETCKFGAKTLKVGQYFEKLNFKDMYGRSFEKVKCECGIPPLAKCVNV